MPHSYQGKEGAFEGSGCAAILDKYKAFCPYMEGDYHGFFFMVILDAFKKVKDGVFGNNLVENWEQVIADFKSALDLCVEACDMKITPKFHIIMEHVPQYIKEEGIGLAQDNEAVVEASHHVWQVVWNHYKVLDKNSPYYPVAGLKTIIRVNSDNT